MKKTIPTLYIDKKDCMGCSACFSVCTNKAILMVEDEEGFLYPKINESLCKKCQLCVKVCVLKEDKDEHI